METYQRHFEFAQKQLQLLNPENYQNLVELFLSACDSYAEKTAFYCLEQGLTFAELEQASRKFAAYLQSSLKLKPGDRIAIQLPNLNQYPIVAWGAIRAGLILVNTNPLYTERELAHQLKDSGAKVVVVLAEFLPTLEKVVAETAVEKVVVTNVFDMIEPQPAPESSLGNILETFPTAISIGEGIGFSDLPLTMDSVLALQYTGGTTGAPKGAVLTHGNMFACSQQILSSSDAFEYGKEIFIAPLPLYHIYGFNAFLVNMVFVGGTAVLIPDPRDLNSLINTIKPFQFTGFTGVNTLFVALLDHPEFSDIDFSQLKFTISGGAALIPDVAEQWESITGNKISEGYGMSESAAIISMNRPGAQIIGTVGQAAVGTEIKVVDDDGNECEIGSEGELLARGPQVFQGYWNRPEATSEVLDNEGWLRTGDIAILQDNGFLKIVDRKKDMIIVSGFNVYPNEVESVVSEHPDILECAVVGVEDKKSAEAVKLFAVRKNEKLTEDEIIKFCRQKLTGYKVPKLVEFVVGLPKTNVGKVLRRELRK